MNLTHPDAIKSLLEVGKVYVDERTDRQGLFHPKFYLFKTGNQYALIIGSANLTAGAFTHNSEASVRLWLDPLSARPLLVHFEELRKTSVAVTSRWLKQYKNQYKPPRGGVGKRLAKAESPPHRTGQRDFSAVGKLLTYRWPDYYKLLRRQSIRKDGTDTLFDPEQSYLKTLAIVQPIIRKRFDRVQGGEFRYLIGGRETEPNTGYFGSLTGAGYGLQALKKNQWLRRNITTLLPSVRKARDEESALSAARKLFLSVIKVRGAKNAVATRLLTLSRPDLFFSVNNESLDRLARVFGIRTFKLRRWDGYEEALRKLWQSKWYRSPRPRNLREARVWDARAALLDVYASEYEW